MTYKAMAELSVVEVAEVLFATSLQESDHPAPAEVRAAVGRSWTAGGGDTDRFAARLAQEAGDHPEQTARRMRWALAAAAAAEIVYPSMQLAG